MIASLDSSQIDLTVLLLCCHNEEFIIADGVLTHYLTIIWMSIVKEREMESLLHLLGYTNWINHSMPSSSGGKRSESGRRPEMRAELPRMR